MSAENHRHAGSQPAGVHVGHGRGDAERRQVGDARDDVAPADQRAFLRQHPRQHAVAIRLRRRQVEEAPRLRRLLVERSALERESLQLHGRSLLRVAPLLPQLRQLDLRLLDRQLGTAQRLAGIEPLFEQLTIRIEPGLRRLELEGLHLEASIEIDERFLERQPRLRLLVLLDLEILDDLVERQHRLADVELDDGIALLQMGARPLQDLEHARVERAREHSLHFGHDRAGGRDDGLDGTCGDRRRADARTRERGPNPPGQRRENHGNEHGRDDDFQHAPQALLRFDTRGKRTIHAAIMTKGRAVLGQQFQ